MTREPPGMPVPAAFGFLGFVPSIAPAASAYAEYEHGNDERQDKSTRGPQKRRSAPYQRRELLQHGPAFLQV